MAGKKVATITIDGDLWKSLRRKALDQGTSASAVISELVRQYLAGRVKVSKEKR